MSLSMWTWVVVGDSSGARIFKQGKPTAPWELVKSLSGFINDEGDGTRDFGKKSSIHKGALHGHGDIEHSSKETAERRFAHQLARVLERGLAARAFSRLVLVAQPKLLGELRENLSRGLKAMVAAEFNKDYVHLTGAELRRRLQPDIPNTLNP